MGKLQLKIITPEDVKLDEQTDMVIMRCTTGDMGILPGREACSAILDYSVLRILTGGIERRMAVFGGIAQVRDDVVTILANDAQWPDDIDRARAQAEHDEAEQRIRESVDDVEIQRDQVMLRRTLVQIEVSSYPLISAKIEREEDEGQ